MGPIKLLYDTNILIDQLRGIQSAIDELRNTIDPHISIVTWIEVLAGARTPQEEAKIYRLLSNFTILALTQPIAERAAVLRRERPRLKLPDAIILATAQFEDRTLVTRNTRDFPDANPAIHIPYTL